MMGGASIFYKRQRNNRVGSHARVFIELFNFSEVFKKGIGL